MATQAESAHAAQTGLAVVVGRQVDQAWHLIDPADLESTLPKFKLAVAALVRRFGLASGSLAAQFYTEQRREAGILSRFTVRQADPAPIEQVDKAISWATRGVWQPNPVLEPAKVQSTGATEKMVLDAGRQTVLDTANADPKARGWARVTRPGCCYFCAMLATRGAVYKENTVGFEAHDHDRCIAEPVFTAYEPTAQIRQWQADWARVASKAADPLLAWRQHFENRTPVA